MAIFATSVALTDGAFGASLSDTTSTEQSADQFMINQNESESLTDNLPNSDSDDDQTIQTPQNVYAPTKNTPKVTIYCLSRSMFPDWIIWPLFIGIVIFCIYDEIKCHTVDKPKDSKPVIIPKEELFGVNRGIKNKDVESTKFTTQNAPNSSDILNDDNIVGAIGYILQKALQGDPRSQCLIGELYENGFASIPKDFSKAAEWIRKAAGQGDAEAQFHLGRYYENGIGVQKNSAKALEWYQKSAEQENENGMISLGLYYYSNEDPQKAVSWWEKAAMKGNAKAQCVLAKCYENGEGVEKDPAKAVEWYLKAVDQGFPAAQTGLGLCYMNGVGVPKDPAKAMEWWLKAAEKDDPEAQTNLGSCYEDGTVVEKDLDKAKEWFQKAAHQGHANALFRLGMLYLKNSSDPDEINKGKPFFQKAADLGHEGAKTILKGFDTMSPQDLQTIVNILFQQSDE